MFLLVQILTILTINHQIGCNKLSSSNWMVIENLAERYPYIVGLLNRHKEYVCSGAIIGNQTILTSGDCVILDPRFTLVGMAILGKPFRADNIYHVNYVRLHPDYSYEMSVNNPSYITMYSNIGLVYLRRPVLHFFMHYNVGRHFAQVLKESELIAVGYGRLKDRTTVALQHQAYKEVQCQNPEWFYCVCGIETDEKTYEIEFGGGSPVLYSTRIVAVAATPVGKLVFHDQQYNIFTVIRPYLAWIDKPMSAEERRVLRSYVMQSPPVERTSDSFRLVSNWVTHFTFVMFSSMIMWFVY